MRLVDSCHSGVFSGSVKTGRVLKYVTSLVLLRKTHLQTANQIHILRIKLLKLFQKSGKRKYREMVQN